MIMMMITIITIIIIISRVYHRPGHEGPDRE
jgi:hypothetical protein